MKKKDSNKQTLKFDSRIYPQAALMGAAYKYLDRLYSHFEFEENGSRIIKARIESKNNENGSDWAGLVEEFESEILSQSLRLKILKATKKTRDQIMTIALTCTPINEQAEPDTQQQKQACTEQEMDSELQDILKKLKDDSSDDNYMDDPMDIAVPWEEKYSRDK